MSRADRIVNRRAWFTSCVWHDSGKGYRQRKTFKRWALEWILFRTHDDKKVEAGIAKLKEAKAAADAEAEAHPAGA